MIRRVTYDLFIIFHDALSKITKFTVPGTGYDTFWYSGTGYTGTGTGTNKSIYLKSFLQKG